MHLRTVLVGVIVGSGAGLVSTVLLLAHWRQTERGVAIAPESHARVQPQTPSFDNGTAFVVYDRAPELPIAGSGFDSLDPAILQLSFVPTLKLNEDFTLAVDSSNMMTLSLKSGKRWVTLDPEESSAPLNLTMVKSGDDILLNDSVQIATVLQSPSVEASYELVYKGVYHDAVVTGTNFDLNHTVLFFDPPLQAGEVAHTKILSSTQISVQIYRFRHISFRAPEPRPLKLVAIDTGAGKLMLEPENGGVEIAQAQLNLACVGMSVRSHERLRIYQSTKTLKILGTGLAEATQVRFANPQGAGIPDFIITDSQPEQVTLELVEGSKWWENPEVLPGHLGLMSLRTKHCWKTVKPTTAKHGVAVATILEDPGIEASDVHIYRTSTPVLEIIGKGFDPTPRRGNPILFFEPAIDTSRITAKVVNRTMVRLTLTANSEWTSMENLGPLTIKGVDTGAGMVMFDAPVVVATVVPDPDTHESGVAANPASQPRQVVGRPSESTPPRRGDGRPRRREG